MCPQCEKIMDLLKANRRGPGRLKFLARFVPQHLQEVSRYFDQGRGTIIYVMQCNHCGQVFYVPH